MSISDRDRKIIYFMLILVVTILPYTLYIKNQKITTESIVAGNQELQARYDYLSQLNDQRDLYEKATAKYNADIETIVAGFPADIKPENFTMFLLNTEYDTYPVIPRGEEANFLLNERHYLFNSVAYVDNVESQISNENTDTGYVALTNISFVNYIAVDYESFKYMIEFLLEYPDPVMYSGITMDFDEKTGNITGEMQIAQYAITGADRELEDVDIWPDLDANDIRGNEEVGVFGEKDVTLIDELLPEDVTYLDENGNPIEGEPVE